ncbi:hypothetical protein DL93DRAFT_2161631 [Clavulina sp. PMI_390]|nr:hypothetical protein DL93DRAFT_2161631 [Clavulina sp. PMI_390]
MGQCWKLPYLDSGECLEYLGKMNNGIWDDYTFLAVFAVQKEPMAQHRKIKMPLLDLPSPGLAWRVCEKVPHDHRSPKELLYTAKTFRVSGLVDDPEILHAHLCLEAYDALAVLTDDASTRSEWKADAYEQSDIDKSQSSRKVTAANLWILYLVDNKRRAGC